MTEETKAPRPVILCILDGWGHRAEADDNAIAQAHTPVLDRLARQAPHALIDASEHEVGLPAGQMGNSEVGHMNIGAGRVVMQDLVRIDEALETGALAEIAALKDFIAALKASGGRAHLMGLLSPGGVHSHQDQMAGLAKLLLAAGIPVALHGFLDGRDTPPRSAPDYLAAFRAAVPEVEIATLSGRYYAMDRDQRWDRVARAYGAIHDGEGAAWDDPAAAITHSHGQGVSDEFLEPCVIDGYAGMADGDGLLMANFRADRAREILHALLDPAFDGFERRRRVRFAAAVGLVEYSSALNAFLTTLFPPASLSHGLGETVAAAGRTQLRIAETEKYAHVTFFLNGGREACFPGEERILVPSPRVATYDLQPEMSAPEVTDRLVEAIESDAFDLIVVNYANGDMVGHSGKLAAAIQAAECVDRCIGRLVTAVEAAGGAMVITADHGNAEQMHDGETGQPHTAHTMNRVPILLAGAPAGIDRLEDGRLADIAPTLLALMALEQPAEMTGRSLLRPLAQTGTRSGARSGSRPAAAE